MADPLISVLMPAYKHEHYVRAAVASVLAQTHANLELIVIDDASPDGTWEVLGEVRDDRLCLHRHDGNQGAHATLNEALAMARGEFIAILNSDDVFAPTRLERLLVEAGGSNTDFFAFTDVAFVDETDGAAAVHPRAVAHRSLCELCDTLNPANWFLAGNPAVSTSNFFFSRALLKKVGDFAPLRYTHDWDWALRACRHVTPVRVREPLLSYRVHAANTLAEADAWRHIHENSHIQARALLALPQRENSESAAFETCRALLGNESFHPLALLCYLVYRFAGIGEQRLETLSQGMDAHWWLRELADVAAYPEDIFLSARHLIEREAVIAGQESLLEERLRTIEQMGGEIAWRDEAIAGQAALIEERWNSMQRMGREIARRDEAIAGQAALIEERWNSMQRMHEEMASLDGRLVALNREWGVLQGERNTLRRELDALHGDILVRGVLYLRKWLDKIGWRGRGAGE